MDLIREARTGLVEIYSDEAERASMMGTIRGNVVTPEDAHVVQHLVRLTVASLRFPKEIPDCGESLEVPDRAWLYVGSLQTRKLHRTRRPNVKPRSESAGNRNRLTGTGTSMGVRGEKPRPLDEPGMYREVLLESGHLRRDRGLVSSFTATAGRNQEKSKWKSGDASTLKEHVGPLFV